MVHQVLRIPELLSIIFQRTDERSNAACAIVCKQWLDVALNELWRYLDNPVVFLQLLAPMHTIPTLSDEAPRWLFSRFVLPSDWSRFQFYANRIKHLSYDETSSIQCIDASVYAEVARTRPTLIVLPKLQRFVWHTKLLNHAILFMNPNITYFVAKIDEPFLAAEGFLEARAFLLETAQRLPNLISLDIRASFSVLHVQAALLHLLKSMTRLKNLILPRYWLTSSVISALAASQTLEGVQWEYVNQGEGDIKDVASFEVSASSGAFPALNDLSLEVNLQDATRFLDSPFLPANLATFYVQSLQLTPPPDIHDFFDSCSTRCRCLTYLCLDLHFNNPSETPDMPRITLSTLEPVLLCPTLVQFTLNYNSPLAITDSDAKVMAERWPSLVTLHLNPGPVILSVPELTLAALLPFADHCPELTELGLYINATAPVPPISHTRPFKKLRRLEVGTSPIGEANPVALFLSHICPSTDPELSVGLPWDPALKAAIEPDVKRQIHQRRTGWLSVAAYLPMLVALRSEERSRSKRLEDELAELRALNQALEVRAVDSRSHSRRHRAVKEEF